MSLKKSKSRFGSRVLFFFVALSLSWALSIGVGFGEGFTPEDEKAYKEAMQDTEVAEQSEISTRLLAVVPPPRYDTLNDDMLHGSSITWENPADPNSRVLVETMVTQWDYDNIYGPKLGQETTINFSNWVTVVPELKNYFIGSESCPPTQKRIIQLKGLNPAREYSWLVEIWVNPKDLFRPAPDPEITDHEGELSVRKSEKNWTFPSDDNAFVSFIDTELYPSALYLEKGFKEEDEPIPFRTWFNAAAEPKNYDTDKPIGDWNSPWTRLGYTYDWGNSDDHLGVSEFRIILNPTSRVVNVKIKKDAVDLRERAARAAYFRCVREDAAGGSSGGCFVKTPH